MEGNKLVGDSNESDIDRTPRDFTAGGTHISTTYDNSYHDNSKRHYGDIRGLRIRCDSGSSHSTEVLADVTTTNYNGDLTGMGVKQMRSKARDCTFMPQSLFLPQLTVIQYYLRMSPMVLFTTQRSAVKMHPNATRRLGSRCKKIS